jgi:hypothetical protein
VKRHDTFSSDAGHVRVPGERNAADISMKATPERSYLRVMAINHSKLNPRRPSCLSM